MKLLWGLVQLDARPGSIREKLLRHLLPPPHFSHVSEPSPFPWSSTPPVVYRLVPLLAILLLLYPSVSHPGSILVLVRDIHGTSSSFIFHSSFHCRLHTLQGREVYGKISSDAHACP
eukprot:TRINITY_DN209_c0_g2_i1.p1 TRINITY_DN209_c0_g2~~TRINITY_DN209_c0_g2_i1.p1  ORF type:complete len:117 (+),score=0.91 TRINITY_DN209_c0_g2_i1:171-521(+)